MQARKLCFGLLQRAPVAFTFGLGVNAMLELTRKSTKHVSQSSVMEKASYWENDRCQ